MKLALKLLAAWAAFALSIQLTGLLAHLFHLPINVPADSNPAILRALAFAASGAVLVLGIWPIARGLSAAAPLRIAVIALFLCLALGVNTILDGTIYTTSFNGAIASSMLFYCLLAVAVSVALGSLFGHSGHPSALARRHPVSLAGCTLLALLCWPFIYLFFGACIAPIVLPYYRSSAAIGMHIPPMPVILAVQLVRSLVFLSASLPLILLWKGSRSGLWFALGLAHSVAVGLFGLAGATFLPTVLRITHSAEITCDSFAYAGLLVLLFAASKPQTAPRSQPLGQSLPA